MELRGRIVTGVEDVTFSAALLKMAFSQITETLTKDDGGLYTKNKGYHVKLITELMNVGSDDYIALRWLLQRINTQIKENGTLTVKPNYDSTQSYNLSFAMICTSDISIINEDRSGQWQSLTLDWQTKDPVTDIDDFVADPETTSWVDMDGNFIVDQDGNQIIFSE